MALTSVRRYRILWLVVVFVVIVCVSFYPSDDLSDRQSLGSQGPPSWAQRPQPAVSVSVSAGDEPSEEKTPDLLSESPSVLSKPPGVPSKPPSLPSEPLGLPSDYQKEDFAPNQWCEDRFGTAYLEHARDSQTSYCTPESQSKFTCFWTQISPDENPRTEAMCYGRGAVFDPRSRRFNMDCQLRALTPAESQAGVHRVPDDLPVYWYNTGPGTVMTKHVGLDGEIEDGRPNRTTILVKREGDGNLWHCLMEIMTFSMTLDVLQISLDPDTMEPYLTARDGETVEVVILDEHNDGPYIDLWRMFAKLPIRRLTDLGEDEPPTNIVLPFGGASNALWQGDWKPLECRNSPLVKTFSRRVLDHLGVIRPPHGEDVAVTFIKRTSTRKLVNETELLEAARQEIPHMKLEEVDFATIPLTEQLAVVQRTDLLAGVHGAGLTHALFLAPGSAVAEILPDNFFHKGFRNVAQLMGCDYFSTHAEPVEPAAGGEHVGNGPAWQMSDVQVDKDKFVAWLREAVLSLYNKGGRSFDVV